MEKFYSLPELSYDYKDIVPFLSEEQLKIHHQKHHQAYVNGANAALEKLDKARKENADIDMKALLKELSFHIGGYVLHDLFWKNLKKPVENNEPSGKLADAIKDEFGSFERFKKEFSQAALSVEGSGWAALIATKETDRLMVMHIEKHNVNLYPQSYILVVLDLWEHAYYLDYKNEKGKYIDAFWNSVDWGQAQRRFDDFLKM